VITINNSELKQVKISVDAKIAEAFKTSCLAADVSMSSILSIYMNKYSKASTEKKSAIKNLGTKRQRRTAIDKIIQQLVSVRNSEEDYQGRIPDNLRTSDRFESAETWISTLDEVIDLLGGLP
jgi:hypothetical protein